MAITLELSDDRLAVRLSGAQLVLSLCRTLSFPVSAVTGVCAAPRQQVPATGLRLPGTSIAGRLRAGSFGRGAERDFWCVALAEQVLVVQLEPGQPYRRLVLEVPDAHAEALRLRPVLGSLVL